MNGFAALARTRNLIQLRRYDDALDAVSVALGDPSTQAEAWCLRTQALLGKGDLKRALPAAHRAIGLRPDHEWAHRLLALVLMRRHRPWQARRAAEEAVRISPRQVETLHLLAICQANTRKKSQAQTTANMMLTLHPHSALAHHTAGTVAMVRRDWAAAEPHLRESLRLEPDDAEVAASLADVLQHLGRREEAGEALLAAARADPTNHSIRKSLGRLGLPLGAFGGLGVLKIALAHQASLLVVNLHPATAVTITAAGFTIIGGYLSYARVAATRALPANVHRGLMGDHRNYALSWLGSAALVSFPLAAWAASAPKDKGQSPALAIGLALFCVVGITVMLKFWAGPFPKPFSNTTAWFAQHRPSRRS